MKRGRIIGAIGALILILTVIVIAKLNKPHIEADKVTRIVANIRNGESKEITDKDKINEIVKYVNSKSYIPAIFIPKMADDFEITFYYEGSNHTYYSYGYEIMHVNNGVYRSKPETGEKLKELTGLKKPASIPPSILKATENQIPFSKNSDTEIGKGNREYKYVVKSSEKSLWLKLYITTNKGVMNFAVKNPYGQVLYSGRTSDGTKSEIREFPNPIEGEWIITTKAEAASGNLDIQWYCGM